MVTLLGFKVDESGREQYNKGIDQTKQKQQSLTAAFLKANVIMGAAQNVIGAAIGFVRDSVIGATAETERYRVTIGQMIGDQEKANQVIHDLDYSPVSDFYGTAAAIGGLRSFVTMGMDIDKASQQMTLLGDVAQGSSEAFNSLSANMAQIYSKGKADAEDLKQFMAHGFNVAGVLGLTDAQKKAGVTYTQVEEALKRVTDAGGTYHKMLEQQMNTLGGVIKQFESFKAATAEAIGTGMSDELKELLKYILEIGRAGQESFVNGFVAVLKEVIHWIFQIIIMFKVLGFRIEDMGDAFTPVKTFFLDLKDAAGDVLMGLMILLVEVGQLIVAAFRPFQAYVSPIMKALGKVVKEVFTTIAEALNGFIPLIGEFAPSFQMMGDTVAALLIKLTPLIKGFIKYIAAYAKVVIAFFSPIIETVIPIIQKIYSQIGQLFETAGEQTDGLAGIINNLIPLFSVLGKIVSAIFKIIFTSIGRVIGIIVSLVSVIIKATNFSIKIFSNIVTAIKTIFSGLGEIWRGEGNIFVKIWESYKLIFIQIWKAIIANIKAIGDNFIGIWNWVKASFIGIWNGITGFFKKWGETILQILAVTIFNIPGLIAVAVRQIIKHWDIIGPKIKAVIDAVSAAWNDFSDFIYGLWQSITASASNAWNGLVSIASGVVEGIKNIWNSITGFFSGLWEALMQGPTEAVEYIKNAFFGLFNSIQEKLFGFLNKVKEGWESVKGFFGGIAEGVVNVITGGGGNGGGGQMQPAYAGGATQAAVAAAVGPTSNYAYHNNTGGSSTVNANTSINVTVPQGTTQTQSEAIGRQIDAHFNARIAESINSSRANIPSPEVRRY